MFKQLGVLVPLCASLATAGCAMEEFDEYESEVINGYTTANNTTNNAVVYLAGGCSGTLVAEDVVLTARNCVSGVLTMDPSLHDGQWHPLPTINQMEVRVGPDSENPVFTTRATWFNVVPKTETGGWEDISFIGLETPVPAAYATPRPVRTTMPSNFSTSTHYLYGYGLTNGSSRWRTYSTATGYTMFTGVDVDTFMAQLPSGRGTQLSDRGGPTFYNSWSGPVIGVTKTTSTLPTFWGVATFATGNANSPNVASWAERGSIRTLCSAIGDTASTTDGGLYRKMQNWWSSGRSDNFATTFGAWTGCVENFDRTPGAEGYGFWRHDGWVASPDKPRPADTRPLYAYWNGTAKDNAALISYPGSGWAYAGHLGYIWTSPGPGRIPLYAWYSASRNDYHTTTSTTDYSSAGYSSRGIIGYLKDANLSCVDSCGGAAPGACYCDPVCTYYGDCCGDYEEVCL